MLKAFQKFQPKLVRELEKKLDGKHVVLIGEFFLKSYLTSFNAINLSRPLLSCKCSEGVT